MSQPSGEIATVRCHLSEKVEFLGTTFIIPKDTYLNPDKGNIVEGKEFQRSMASVIYVESYYQNVAGSRNKKVKENR